MSESSTENFDDLPDMSDVVRRYAEERGVDPSHITRRAGTVGIRRALSGPPEEDDPMYDELDN